MSIVTKHIGKVQLLSVLLTFVVALGSANVFAQTPPATSQAKNTKTAKTKAPSKTMKAKKKRRHARRSTRTSVKKG